MKTCRLCGWRPATKITGWEGRIIDACTTCLRAPERPREPWVDVDELSIASRAVYFARTHEGLNAQQIGERLGLDELRDRNAVSTALLRAVKSGVLRADDSEGRILRKHFRGARAWEPRGYVRVTVRERKSA